MAEEEAALSSVFPAPPPFYKRFTAQNLERLESIKAEAPAPSATTDATTALRLLELPPELRNLVPPELPADGKYRCFGEDKNINQALQPITEDTTQILYPSSARADLPFHLRKVIQSILLNYLELVGILSIDPSLFINKIEDLQVLYQNAHLLINEYRPHQARETLILMMEEQLEREKAEVEGIKAMKVKVEEVLGEINKGGPDLAELEKEANQRPASPEDGRKNKQRMLWRALEEEKDTSQMTLG